MNYLRPLHESVAKEKSSEISLIEVGNEAINKLLASFPTKSSGISTIFTRHPTRAKVSIYLFFLLLLVATALLGLYPSLQFNLLPLDKSFK